MNKLQDPYECFKENESAMKTFHNCKPYKKEHRALSKFFISKKSTEAMNKLQDP